MNSLFLLNGEVAQSISLVDRGLLYGDGVFRTLRLSGGRPLCWARQYAKLAADCAALRLECPGASLWEADIQFLAGHQSDAVIKLMVTRGPGGRGYRAPESARGSRVAQCFPLPEYPALFAREGVRVRLCDTRLARQPRLAGIKHLNRLENVLARSEWSDEDVPEGLMCDEQGHVIEGTQSNLFIVRSGQLLTPSLTQCGVSGMQRQRVMDIAGQLGVPVQVCDLKEADVHAADEVLLCNSLIGIWPVREFQSTCFKVGDMTRRLQLLVEKSDD